MWHLTYPPGLYSLVEKADQHSTCKTVVLWWGKHRKVLSKSDWEVQEEFLESIMLEMRCERWVWFERVWRETEGKEGHFRQQRLHVEKQESVKEHCSLRNWVALLDWSERCEDLRRRGQKGCQKAGSVMGTKWISINSDRSMEPLKNFKQGIDMIRFVILKLEQQCLAKVKERGGKNRTQSGACYNNPGKNWWGLKLRLILQNLGNI